MALNVSGTVAAANVYAGQSYAFRIAASNIGGKGPWSNMYLHYYFICLFILFDKFSFTYTTVGLPTAPIGIAASNFDSNKGGVLVSWTTPFFSGSISTSVNLTYSVQYSIDSIL